MLMHLIHHGMDILMISVFIKEQQNILRILLFLHLLVEPLLKIVLMHFLQVVLLLLLLSMGMDLLFMEKQRMDIIVFKYQDLDLLHQKIIQQNFIIGGQEQIVESFLLKMTAVVLKLMWLLTELDIFTIQHGMEVLDLDLLLLVQCQQILGIIYVFSIGISIKQ